MTSSVPLAVSGYPLDDLFLRPVPPLRGDAGETYAGVLHHLRAGGIVEVLLLHDTQHSQPGISYAMKFELEPIQGHPEHLVVRMARLRYQVNENEKRVTTTKTDDDTMMGQLKTEILAWHAAFFGPARSASPS